MLVGGGKAFSLYLRLSFNPLVTFHFMVYSKYEDLNLLIEDSNGLSIFIQNTYSSGRAAAQTRLNQFWDCAPANEGKALCGDTFLAASNSTAKHKNLGQGTKACGNEHMKTSHFSLWTPSGIPPKVSYPLLTRHNIF